MPFFANLRSRSFSRGLLRFLLSAVFATSLCYFAIAAGGEVRGSVDCNQFGYCLISDLTIIGSIDDSTIAKLTTIVAEFDRKVDRKKQPDGFSHTRIELDSPGGSVSAAMTIGRLLRKNRMTAQIPPSGQCSSACVLIYAGAVTRFGHFRAGKIGIHQPFLDVPANSIDPDVVKNRYQAVLQEMRSYFREMNVSEQLADEMLKVPISTIRYLSHKEQDHFGLVIFDPVEIEVGNLEHAQALGVSRAEYNRREALILSHCPLDSDYSNCNETVFKTGKLPIPPNSSSHSAPALWQQLTPKRRH